MKQKVSNSYEVDGIRYMMCSCGREVKNVGDTAVSVKCSRCVTIAVGFPDEPKSTYTPTGRPAGWHWMNEFVDKDGNVFHKGKEMPKLKGTLKPTKVVPKKKPKKKRRTKEQMLVVRAKEKKSELKRAVKKQKDFINHNFRKD
ncbi:hypothetical protein H8D04_00425 [bacterium]|nr:hypothetical protein [bacterium]